MNSNFKNESYFRIEKEKNIFIIIRKISDDIIEKINIKNKENKLYNINFNINNKNKKKTIKKKRINIKINKKNKKK